MTGKHSVSIEKHRKSLKKYENLYDPIKLHGNRLDVNAESVFRLGLIHCTIPEVAAVLGCSEGLIRTKFLVDLHRGHEDGQMSIKRKMHEKAIAGAGDTSMLIFLSKQRCGYVDRKPDEAPNVAFCVYVNEIPK